MRECMQYSQSRLWQRKPRFIHRAIVVHFEQCPSEEGEHAHECIFHAHECIFCSLVITVTDCTVSTSWIVKHLRCWDFGRVFVSGYVQWVAEVVDLWRFWSCGAWRSGFKSCKCLVLVNLMFLVLMVFAEYKWKPGFVQDWFGKVAQKHILQ